MTRTSKRTWAVAAAVLLPAAVSCGPKVVVARLATPTPGVSAPAAPAPPTPRAQPATAVATPPSTPTPTPASRSVPAPSPTETPIKTATRPAPAPSATATARPARPAPSATATATALPERTAPAPSATATARPARPAAPATATATPVPPGSPTPPPPSPAAAATSTAEPSFAGEWDFRAHAGKGVIAGTLRFRPVSGGLGGVYVGGRGNATELSNLRAAGGRISFDLVTPTAVWHLEGTLTGDRIEGTFVTAERTIRWTAARKPDP